MSIGPWIASAATFEAGSAAASIAAHDSALQALRALPTAVIGSRVMPFLCEHIDLARVADAQRNYPCYVREIDTLRR